MTPEFDDLVILVRHNIYSVADLRIIYTSLLDDTNPVLTAADLERSSSSVATTPGNDAPGATDTTVATAPPVETLAINQARRDELLLIYLNRIVDLILRGR